MRASCHGDDRFDVFLNSACEYFIIYCIPVHKGTWLFFSPSFFFFFFFLVVESLCSLGIGVIVAS
jgi:hypothetical protein